MGSAAGSTFQAIVHGVGPEDQLTLVDSSGNDLCETATVIAYSILQCQTKAEEVALTQVSVKDLENDVTYPCVN